MDHHVTEQATATAERYAPTAVDASPPRSEDQLYFFAGTDDDFII
jgi:hypothetical protein